jgi:hypothetical protein
MAEPFEFAGAFHETTADPFPGTAVTVRGADGAPFTAAALDALDAAEVPAALVAVTLNV